MIVEIGLKEIRRMRRSFSNFWWEKGKSYLRILTSAPVKKLKIRSLRKSRNCREIIASKRYLSLDWSLLHSVVLKSKRNTSENEGGGGLDTRLLKHHSRNLCFAWYVWCNRRDFAYWFFNVKRGWKNSNDVDKVAKDFSLVPVKILRKSYRWILAVIDRPIIEFPFKHLVGLALLWINRGILSLSGEKGKIFEGKFRRLPYYINEMKCSTIFSDDDDHHSILLICARIVSMKINDI